MPDPPAGDKRGLLAPDMRKSGGACHQGQKRRLRLSRMAAPTSPAARMAVQPGEAPRLRRLQEAKLGNNIRTRGDLVA